MERIIADHNRSKGWTFVNDGPLYEAQELVFDAWECTGKRKRIALAKRALEISNLCCDAYLILADDLATNAFEARYYIEKALRAGEKALGPEVFEKEVGNFWGIVETRPYMRARASLAIEYWDYSERKKAIAMHQESLRLNPNDNQALRQQLMMWLMTVRDFTSLEKLLDQYKDDLSIATKYTKALLEYVYKGDCRRSRKALEKALEYNSFVPELLVGLDLYPLPLDYDYYMPRSYEEAELYVETNWAVWRQIEGAIRWITKHAPDSSISE